MTQDDTVDDPKDPLPEDSRKVDPSVDKKTDAEALEAVENAKRESRRSAVRIAVTYIAAGFLFLVGAAVVGYLLAIGDIATAKDIFLTILPVAAAIVTYWYAGRKGDESAVKIIEALRKGGN